MLKNKISPLVATLICINTMIAAGLFINPRPLTQIAGPLGFMGYVLSATILFPLLLCIAELAKLHPVSGGLYVYSKEYLGVGAGFLSGWCYFLGKTTTVALLLHKFVQFFQSVSPCLATIPTLALDFSMIFFLVALNIGGVKIGGSAQYFFTLLKGIPILFAFGVGFFFFSPELFVFDQSHVLSAFLAIPIAVFPLLGFEIICAIGHLIENPEANIKRVIIQSFLIVATIDILFQLTIFGVLGNNLLTEAQPMFALGLKAFPHIPLIGRVVNGAVVAAFLGACFSILTSNCWNLFTLAKNNHVPFSGFLTKVTSLEVPWVCLLIQASLGCTILAISSETTSLQYMSVFAQIMSILLSALAALVATIRISSMGLPKWVPVFGIASCLYILLLCLKNIIACGVSLPFLSLFLFGIGAALWKAQRA